MRIYIFILFCIVASLIPIITVSTPAGNIEINYQFPVTLNSNELVEIKLTEPEQKFYGNFPGKIGSFMISSYPDERIVLRITDKPTRFLHSAEGCYKAHGYKIEFMDNKLMKIEELSDKQLRWSQFKIKEKTGSEYIVLQTIISLSSEDNYPDIPKWYWKTTFSSEDKGPWLAITWKKPL